MQQLEKLLLLQKSVSNFVTLVDHMRLTSNDLCNKIEGGSKENLQLLEENIGCGTKNEHSVETKCALLESTLGWLLVWIQK